MGEEADTILFLFFDSKWQVDGSRKKTDTGHCFFLLVAENGRLMMGEETDTGHCFSCDSKWQVDGSREEKKLIPTTISLFFFVTINGKVDGSREKKLMQPCFFSFGGQQMAG
ncbi:hypothetical protein AVEN_106549-1 [Araneus ventricosus]|uniref:Uncharacterized protein n=1 Tax=Araneus ventricosus TaxID=182803 RepID=A0A4Y2RKJ3_ARAVE|nr:hypothetical protein AVEN_106549-1 [Araneus ventricosus]